MQQLLNKKGTSLVELLLMGLVVGFVALVIFNLPNSFKLVGASRLTSLAKQIADMQIETLRAQGYNNLGNGTTPLSDSRLSNLPSGSGTVTVTDCPVSICQNGEQIKQVTVEVDWNDNGSKNIKVVTLVANNGLK